MLNLRKRETPIVNFRRALPEYLADGEKCYISIEARAAGAVNPKYLSGIEQNLMSARVMDRQAAKIEDDEEYVKTDRENRRRAAKQRIALLYDACVIDWQSNMLDGDGPIVCNRENFIALAEVRGVPELAKAIKDFETECIKAGAEISHGDEDMVKN